MERVLLIGGNGFIGRHIQSELLKYKEWLVDCIDKQEIDLSTRRSEKAVRKLISDNPPDVIIVLAAIKRQDEVSSVANLLNNAITQNVANALSEFSGQIIYFSSCAVYGEKNEQTRVTETTRLNPTSDYGYHKKYSEELYMKRKNSLAKLLIVRPPLIYSCEKDFGYSPGGFLASAIKTSAINLWGDGNETREFVHVSDVAQVTIKLIERKANGTINLVSGHSYSYREIANYIRLKMNLQIKIHCKPRTGAKVNHTYNNEAIKKILPDFKFTTPFSAIERELNKMEGS